MAIKFRAKTKDEIPAELQSLYVERDGAFVLDVEGAVDKARVDEFRANNIALTNQLAEQRKRFEAIESEQVSKSAESQLKEQMALWDPPRIDELTIVTPGRLDH
jgi:hypothetical protein